MAGLVISGEILMIHRRFASALFAGVVSVSLMGCSNSGSDKAGDQGSSSSSPASDSSSASESDSSESPVPVSQQAEKIGLDPANLPQPLAKETLTISTAKKQTSDVVLYKLEKRGRVMLAYFSVTPHNLGDGDDVFNAFGDRSPDPAFVDLDNLKVYRPAENNSSDFGSNPVYTQAVEGKPSFYWVAFPQFQSQAKNVYLQFAENTTQKHKVPLP